MNLVADEHVRLNRLEQRVSGVLMNRVRSVNALFIAEIDRLHVQASAVSRMRAKSLQPDQLAALLDLLPFSLVRVADVESCLKRPQPVALGAPSEVVRSYLFLARELASLEFTANCAGALLGVRDPKPYARLADEDILKLAALPAEVEALMELDELFDALGRPAAPDRILSCYIHRLTGGRL
jgi:hypothetical protein